MKSFPKTIYVTRSDSDFDSDSVEYFVNDDKKFIENEEPDTEVAIYQLVKIGSVVRKSKIQFE